MDLAFLWDPSAEAPGLTPLNLRFSIQKRVRQTARVTGMFHTVGLGLHVYGLDSLVFYTSTARDNRVNDYSTCKALC